MTKTMIERPDLLDSSSPRGMRVIQLTADPDTPYAHVYMEAQVFSPDSSRLIIERSGNAHGPIPNDQEHHYLILDTTTGELTPITDELNAKAPSFSPDGRYIYYLVDHSAGGGVGVELKRIRPDGTARESLAVYDTPLPGTTRPLSSLYPLSTISSDGRRLATSGYVGPAADGGDSYAVACFELDTGDLRLVWLDPYIKNSHPQYCRASHPGQCHDLLIQHNHGYIWDPRTDQIISRGNDPLGPDIHVISDESDNFRTLPWGRNNTEHCQGHQCWWGKTHCAVTSTQTYLDDGRHEAWLIAGRPIPDTGHQGAATPGATRQNLSRRHNRPRFHHFAIDHDGRRMITDYWGDQNAEHLYLAALGDPSDGPPPEFTYLLDTRTTFGKTTQSHPFLSPHGQQAFFNSDESGNLQTYMIDNLP